DELGAWEVPSVNHHLTGAGLIVPEFMHKGQFVLAYGHGEIRLAFSKNLVAWHAAGQPLAESRRDRFDSGPLKVIAAAHLDQGLLVVYESVATKHGHTTIAIGALLCASTDPERVLWRSDDALAQYVAPVKAEPRSLGAIIGHNSIDVY